MSSYLSKYETFMEAAKTKSMSKAAANTHQTVPGVSYTIAKLEEEWGIPLFARNRGKISLSEAGEALMPFIEDVLKAQERLEQEVLSFKGIEKGTVRVGGLRCVTKQWLPSMLRDMADEYPNIQMELVLNPYEEIQNDLLNGVIDIAFAGEPATKLLDFYYVIDDPFVVVLPENSPLGDREELCLDDLKDQKLIMPNWSTDKEFLSLIEKSRINGQIIHRIKDTGTIVSMVESGIGISVLPYFIADGEKADVKTVKLKDWPVRRFGIVTSSFQRLSPSAKKFLRCARDWLDVNREHIGFYAKIHEKDS